jgi:hypothetical protein
MGPKAFVEFKVGKMVTLERKKGLIRVYEDACGMK